MATADPDLSEVILTPTAMAVGGDAIAREASGRVVFINGALPGETVRVRLGEVKSDFAKGRVTEVIEASAERVAEPCVHRGEGCGGCGWMHVERSAQHRLKVAMVADALGRIAHLDTSVVVAGPTLDPSARRTSVRLAVNDGVVGFHAAASNDHVPIAHCLAAHPMLDELIGLRYSGTGEVLLRCSAATGQRLIDARGVRVLGPPAGVLIGSQAIVHETIAGRRLRVSARSFFQSSPEAAELLVAEVRRAIGGTGDKVGHLVDAYGGVGLFAATIEADRTALIESAPSAVADARANLKGKQTSVISCEVARWRPHPADVVVADPARPGLGKGAAAALATARARLFVLVSCDAASLARDAALLAGHGYRLVESRVLDMFTDTPHVEVVSRFELTAPVP